MLDDTLIPHHIYALKKKAQLSVGENSVEKDH